MGNVYYEHEVSGEDLPFDDNGKSVIEVHDDTEGQHENDEDIVEDVTEESYADDADEADALDENHHVDYDIERGYDDLPEGVCAYE